MSPLFATGHVVDAILMVMALEAAVMMFLTRRGGRRACAVDLMFGLIPGACLLMALRSALTGADWTWTALWLALSFPVHLADLARRRLSAAPDHGAGSARNARTAAAEVSGASS